jgi:hypothetical protein
MKIRALIVDDEPLARRGVRARLELRASRGYADRLHPPIENPL